MVGTDATVVHGKRFDWLLWLLGHDYSLVHFLCIQTSRVGKIMN